MTGYSSDSSAARLLCELADELLTAAALVPQAMNSANGTPVERYILAQGVANSADYQLPEPILHPIDNPDVLVVGFNPNYGQDEVIPRYGSTIEEYVGFYADRFAPHRRDAGRPAGQRLSDGSIYSISHYTKVERLVSEILGTETAFGINTIYCDAIPWKWKQERFPGFGKLDGELAYRRLEKIVLALRPKVILTLGDRTARIVGTWTRDQPTPGLTHGNWPSWHVASYHPDARGGRFQANRSSVQSAIYAALESGRPDPSQE